MTAVSELDGVIGELAARAELIALLDLLSHLLAVVDSDRLDEVFTADVHARFPGSDPYRGLERLQRDAEADLSRYGASQHLILNPLVELEGDTARIRANLLARHLWSRDPAGPFWELGGYYEMGAERTAAGWRISELAITPVWTSGEPGATSMTAEDV